MKSKTLTLALLAISWVILLMNPAVSEGKVTLCENAPENLWMAKESIILVATEDEEIANYPQVTSGNVFSKIILASVDSGILADDRAAVTEVTGIEKYLLTQEGMMCGGWADIWLTKVATNDEMANDIVINSSEDAVLTMVKNIGTVRKQVADGSAAGNVSVDLVAAFYSNLSAVKKIG